jgi:hypothetical protein
LDLWIDDLLIDDWQIVHSKALSSLMIMLLTNI